MTTAGRRRGLTSWRAVARIVGVSLAVVVGIVGFLTVVGLLDRLSWVFEIADVFRVQYVVVLGATGLVALALRRVWLAAAAAAFAAVNVAVLAMPFAAGRAQASGVPAGDLRLVVANVEVGNTDYAAVARLVSETHPDVFGVTELTPVMASQLAELLPAYRRRILEPRSDAYGIGVYSRLPFLSAKVERFPAGGPPTVVVGIRVSQQPVTVVVTHVHTFFKGSIHVRQLNALASAARSEFGKHVVVCGDFNTTPWTGPLQSFAHDSGLRDLYGRHAWSVYTWPTWASALRVPIDNCYVSSTIAVESHRDGPGVGSDHRPLVVDVGVLQ